MRLVDGRSSGTKKLAVLLGSASLFAIAGSIGARAQDQTAQAGAVEEVLVTGSLIHGAAAVGVPVTTMSDQDFKESGAITVADIFKNVPSVNISPANAVTDAGASAERTQDVNIRGLSGKGPRTLLLVDGARYPGQNDSGCAIDPSIIPQLAVDHIDLLADGASATYGSDAVAGVVNVILKRGFQGAISQIQYGTSPDIGNDLYEASQLWGTKWNSGDITLSYEWYFQAKVQGPARDYFTMDYTPWGLDNRSPLVSAIPGIVTVGKPALPTFPTGTSAPAGFSATSGLSCGNCYSIPKGTGWDYGDIAAHLNPTAPGSAPTISWASLATAGNNNVSDEENPYNQSWIEPEQQRNAATVTFDQDIIENVQLFVDGFYDNRRSIIHYPGGAAPAPATNQALTVVVPTTNPYYPTGAPAGLDVSYNFNLESTARSTGDSTGGRYESGFNLDLPYNWIGKVYGAVTEDEESADQTDLINPNMVSAALGNTVPAYGPNGNTPGQAAFTKPANIPYLNVFCDPTQFQCNSPTTIAYIEGFRYYYEQMIIHEYGANADGPLVDLPGGTLRAAVGATHNTYAYVDEDIENYNGSQGNGPNTSVLTNLHETERRNVNAVFAQLNIPVIGDDNQLPLVQKLVFETGVRYDDYNTFGGTTNPKISADWTVIDGLTLKGAWGTSFRAPTFQEQGFVSGTLIQPYNAAAGSSNNVPVCSAADIAAGHPPAGSAAAILDPTCSQATASLFPGGIRLGNGADIAAPVRVSTVLRPETAINESGGFNFTPTDFLKGLDIDFTWYWIKIKNQLGGGNVTLDDPNATGVILPNAAFNPVWNNGNPAPNSVCAGTTTVQQCFTAQATALLANGRSQLNGISPTSIGFIADGAITNIGWVSQTGIDFDARYDWDLGDWGAWNAGFTGNYKLDGQSMSGPGAPVLDTYKDINGDITPKNTGGRLNGRVRLGWNDGGSNSGWSITGFMNYKAHVGNTGTLPSSCFLIGNALCNASGLSQFAPYSQQYAVLTNFIPAYITFDLSIGYKTGDNPTNDYLKNLGIQLTVNDLFNKAPPFQYSISTGSNTPHAFDSALMGPDQRYVTVALTKAW